MMKLSDMESQLVNGRLVTIDDLGKQIEMGVLVPKHRVDEMMKVIAADVAKQCSAIATSKNTKDLHLLSDLKKIVAEVSACHGKKKHKTLLF